MKQENGVKTKLYVFFCLIFVLFTLFLIYPARYLFPEHKTLRLYLELETKEKGFIKIYYDDGRGFRDNLSRGTFLYGTGKYWLDRRFERTIRAVRLDLLDHSGKVILKKLRWRWLGREETLKGQALLKALKPLHQVELSLTPQGVLIKSLGNDPQVLLLRRFEYSKGAVFKDSYLDLRYIGLLSLIVGIWWFFRRYCLAEYPPLQEEDPLLVLRSRKQEIFVGVIFLFMAANFAFYEILWCNHTMVSAPLYRFPGEPFLDVVDGVGYNLDGIGYTIEGPGLWFTHQALFEKHEIPLWNPYEGAGQPYLADGEVAALSLLQLPLHAVPSITNWNRYAVFRCFLAAFFALLWIMSFRVKLPAALFGALAFGFGAVFVSYANKEHPNTALFIPLIFLFLEGLLYQTTWWRFWGLVLALALALNGGNPQPVVATTIFIGTRLFAELRKSVKGFLIKTGLVSLAFVAAAGLTGFTLLPLVELLTKSASRGFSQKLLFQHPNWSPFYLLAPFNPFRYTASFENYWLGPTAGIGAILGAILAPKRLRPYLIAGIIFFSIGIYLPYLSIVWQKLIVRIPVYSSLVFPKYVSPLLLILATCAAIFLHRIKTEDIHFQMRKWIFILTGWILWGALSKNHNLWFPWILTGYAFLVWIAFVHLRRLRPLALVLPLFLLAELAFVYPQYPENIYDFSRLKLPVTEFLKSRLASEPEYRFIAQNDFLSPYVSSYFGLAELRTVTPLPLAEYKNWAVLWAYGSWAHLILSDDTLSLFSPCLSFMGVKYILLDRRLLPSKSFHTLDHIFLFRRDLQGENFVMRSVDPFIFRGKISFDWFIHLKGILKIMVKDTQGFRFFLAGKTYSLSSPNIISIDLRPFYGRVVKISIESQEFSTVKFEIYIPGPEKLPAPWRSIFRNGIFTVYENPSAQPIVRLIKKVSFNSTYFFTPKTLCGETIYLSGYLEKNLPQGTYNSGKEKINSIRYQGLNRMEVAFKNYTPSWLLILINNDGNWRAELDGKPVPIFTAQRTFMAIPIENPGSHFLKLSYQPKMFRLGLLLALLTSLIFLVGSLILGAQRRSRKR